MLTPMSNEQLPPPDQPMAGTCMSCGKSIACRFLECKMVDDPPMGKVPMIGCPFINGRDFFGKPLACGAKVRMKRLQ